MALQKEHRAPLCPLSKGGVASLRSLHFILKQCPRIQLNCFTCATGDHPYKEDAFHQAASANYLDKDECT